MKIIGVLLFLAPALVAQGQNGNYYQDRFQTMEACKTAVEAGQFKYYQPSFFSGHRALRDGEKLIALEERACVKMLIVGGLSFVPQAKGTNFIFRNGRAIVREDCGNRVEEVEYVPPPSPPPAPAPPPAPPEEIHLPPPPEFPELGEIEPVLPLPDENFVMELIWEKKGKSWIWKYTPLWCVDVRRPRDLWHPALCAALGLGGYALAGGFANGALVKTPVLISSPLP